MIESQLQSSTDDAMSSSQRLSFDAQGPNHLSEGSTSNSIPSHSAGKLRFCLK